MRRQLVLPCAGLMSSSIARFIGHVSTCAWLWSPQVEAEAQQKKEAELEARHHLVAEARGAAAYNKYLSHYDEDEEEEEEEEGAEAEGEEGRGKKRRDADYDIGGRRKRLAV